MRGCTTPYPRIRRALHSTFLSGGIVLAAASGVVLSLLLSTAVPIGHSTSLRVTATGMLGAATQLGTPSPQLMLTASSSPGEICALSVTTCVVGVDESRVLLTASAPTPLLEWPAVQIAFVVETTAYDGVYDPHDMVTLEKQQGAGSDVCATNQKALCEESNGVPFFVANAQGIANSIAAANPHTSVSFAMVDYAGTGDIYDDYSDQVSYHVDTAQFVPASVFGSVVQGQFQSPVLHNSYILTDEDLADNFLHSSSIRAFYGVLQGSGLEWQNNTHHVVVWMGSTAPRDPSYPEDYCVSPTGMIIDAFPACHGATCEPSYQFPTGSSPTCEGWVRSQDGDGTHSIAWLAHHSPNCVSSVGGVCTIDMIDLWDTPTDPYSQGWPTGSDLWGFPYPGPGSPLVLQDSENILQAGCDLAQATGGSWDGPSFFTCPGGQSGTLVYVAHGPPATPNTNNPSLMSAMRTVSFGPVEYSKVAQGANVPMFSFVPIGNIAVSSAPNFATSCRTSSGFSASCQVTPTVRAYGGSATYGWNWSTDPTNNSLFVGDSWSAAFNVVDTGPPYMRVPIDACVTAECRAAGSGDLFGVYTWATYDLPNTTQRVTQSFPLVQVTVTIAGLPIGTTPPPLPPPPPPAFPVLAPVQINLPQPLGIPVQSPLGTLSVQATAAGLLMAGMTRIMMKNRPVAMQMAMKNGPAQSQFEKSTQTGPEMGRFE